MGHTSVTAIRTCAAEPGRSPGATPPPVPPCSVLLTKVQLVRVTIPAAA
jgi:hypothetical protein